MAVFDTFRKSRTARRWGSLLAAGLLSITLYGCGGSDSAVVVPPPPPPPPTVSTAQLIAAEAAKPANDTATNPTAAFSAMSVAGLVPVTVNSPPVVNFSVFDNGAVKMGLTTSNVSFAIAKLMPGTNGSPDQWVSYVYRTEAGTGFGPGANPVAPNALQATTDSKVATQLVYNADGYYTYTFATDIRDTAKTNGVVFEPGRTHRVAIQLSYTNAAGATVRVNPYYDFTIGADGKSVAVTNPAGTRKVVDIRSCNSCHDKLAFHGGGRLDTQYCAMCHNPGTVDANSGNNLDLMRMVHKIHQGHELPSVMQGGEYAIWGYGNTKHDYSAAAFPQDTRNCTKCHNGDANPAAGVALTTPQGNNWFTKPSRVACGSCHDGINFANGTGMRLNDALWNNANPTLAQRPPLGHAGINFVQADDSKCQFCHDAGGIKLSHITTFATANNPAVEAGIANFSIDLNEVTLNATRNPVFKFRLLKDGVPVTFNTYTAGATVMIDGFTGSGPSLYTAFALPQDGNTAAASDFNTGTSPPSANLLSVWNGTSGNTLVLGGDGYYTATVMSVTVPAAAKMITGGMQSGYTQIFTDAALLAKYPSGLSRPPLFVQKAATGVAGNVARRQVVDTAKCNACHDLIGSNPAFHGSTRTDANACAFCHNGYRTSAGWSANAATMFHAVHGAGKRAVPFTRNASSATDGFFNIVYPGILKNCSGCHLDNTVNFGAAASAAAVANLPLRTDATGTRPTTNTFRISPWAWPVGTENYGSNASYSGTTGVLTDAADATLVSSPIASACLACHDTSLAINHARSAFGSFYEPRSVAKAKGPEACLTCHGAGKVLDAQVIHK